MLHRQCRLGGTTADQFRLTMRRNAGRQEISLYVDGQRPAIGRLDRSALLMSIRPSAARSLLLLSVRLHLLK